MNLPLLHTKIALFLYLNSSDIELYLNSSYIVM